VVTTGAIRRAKLQSNRHHQQTNSELFTRPDALPTAQPTVSEHWSEKVPRSTDLLTSSVPECLPTLFLTNKGFWLPWRGLPSLASTLWCHCPVTCLDTWTTTPLYHNVQYTGTEFNMQQWTPARTHLMLLQQLFLYQCGHHDLVTHVILLCSQPHECLLQWRQRTLETELGCTQVSSQSTQLGKLWCLRLADLLAVVKSMCWTSGATLAQRNLENHQHTSMSSVSANALASFYCSNDILNALNR